MRRYEVGDVVYVKEIENEDAYRSEYKRVHGKECYSDITPFRGDMWRYQGKITWITEVYCFGDDISYDIDADRGRFMWDGAMLERFEMDFDIDLSNAEALI